MKRVAGGLIVPVVLLLAPCGLALGEVFLLKNGGRVEGEILNPDQRPRESYTIKTSLGGQITLSTLQIKQILYQRPEKLEYEKLRPRYADTVEGQWELAEWCRQRSLLSERQTHLERILELDPDHEQARRALGYTKTGEQWTTREQRMLRQGYVLRGGRWMLPQEIQLMEEQRKKDLAEGEWKKKLKLWRDWLGTDRDAAARANILQIDDPFAVKALAYGLKDDDRDQARILFIEALARIGTPGALRILALCAMEDPIGEVRLTCLDYLKEKKDPETVSYFISQLQSQENRDVNRAAVALRLMEDPSAIAPLIDALVTTHKRKVRGRNPGQITAAFPTGGTPAPAGISVGGSGTRIITETIRNRSVLEALVALSGGANFSFDVPRWKSWYTSQQSRPDLDARRD